MDASAAGAPQRCGECGEFGIVPKDRHTANVVIGDFILKEELGEGSRGKVFLAWQRSLARQCAVKFLRANGDSDKNAFLTQARSAVRLIHPNILHCFSVGHTGENYYYAMEYVKGRNLGAMIRDGETLKPGVALDHVSHLVSALSQVWKQHRVAHKAITPRSVILTEEGDVKLADLGLTGIEARRPEGMAGERSTYASPELLREEKTDYRTDIFSLGIILYETIAGRNPYSEVDEDQIHGSRFKLPPLSEYVPDVPPRVAALVAKMTAADPADRHSSYESLIDEINLARLACPQSRLCQEHLRFAEVLRGDGLIQNSPATRRNRIMKAAALILIGSAAFMLGGFALGKLGQDKLEEGNVGMTGESSGSIDSGILRIAALLPDPDGYDVGKETVTLINSSTGRELNVHGFSLSDGTHTLRLKGRIAPGKRLVVKLPEESLVLANSGKSISLLDPNGLTIDEVSYTGEQVLPGREVEFEGPGG